MEALLKDLQYSLRIFRRSPAFTLTAISVLALGIGANTAVFSLVNAVLLKPIPLPEADRIVMLMNTAPGGSGANASPAKFQHWRQQTDVIQQVSAFGGGVVNYTGGDLPEQFRRIQASADYFDLFEAPITLGRSFAAEEDLPGGPKVVLISEEIWERRFGSDPDILGTTIDLSSEPHVVIGVVSEGFTTEFGPQADVWVPFQLDPNTSDQGHFFSVAARLEPGVTLVQAQDRLGASAAAYREKFPGVLGENASFSVEPFQEVFVRNTRLSLLVLAGAVTLVLLIACANVANLLLARATERKHEFAVRAAVGADRGRIVRQLLTESVLLSTTGGVVGLGIGIVGIRALLTVNTAGLPRIGDGGSLVGTDWRVVLFTLAATVITAMIFGLIPALHSSRVDLSGNLKEAGGRSGSGFRQNKARSILVVVEVALAVVLVVGSALLIRTSISLADVDPGFDPTNVLIARTSLTGPRFQTSAGVELAIRNVSERLSSLPGVESASATCCVPLQGGFGLPFSVLGRTAEGTSEGGAGWITVSPDFFEVFSIPVKSGRAFDERDNGSAPGVVVINEAMARQFWPDGDPLQDRIAIGRGVMRELDGDPERQIIGVVGDTRNGALGRDPTPAMYVPQAQLTDAANALNLRLAPTAWLVRTRTQTQSFSQTIQDEIRQISGLPVSDVLPMDDVVLQSVSRQRFNMWLMVVFGSSAVLLAAIGIYGLMSYSVKQRLQEIGIRLALGARTGQIRNMVVFQGMLLALAGIAIGMGGAFGLTRFIESLLFGVETQDPIVFIATPVLLLVIAFLAVWLPANRAGGVNPLDALRYD